MNIKLRMIASIALFLSVLCSGKVKAQFDPQLNSRLLNSWKRTTEEQLSDDLASRKISSVKAARFLGFCEGAINVPIPEFWELAVNGATVDHDGVIRFPFSDDCDADFGLDCTSEKLVVWKSGDFSVGVRDGKIQGPIFLKKQYSSVLTSIQLAECGEFVVISCESDATDPIVVICVDKAKKTVVWKRTMTVHTPLKNMFGSGFTLALNKLVCKDERVVILGQRYAFLYAFGLNLSNGEIAFNFNTEAEQESP